MLQNTCTKSVSQLLNNLFKVVNILSYKGLPQNLTITEVPYRAFVK